MYLEVCRVVVLFYRSSPPEMLLGKCVLKICLNFTREHSCRSVTSIKLLCNFIEIPLRRRCSPANLLHISRTPFYEKNYGGLPLILLDILNVQYSLDLNAAYEVQSNHKDKVIKLTVYRH